MMGNPREDPTAPSAKRGIQSGRNFATSYMELCKQHRLRPLPVICVALPHNLDFTTDRVKMDDWNPILNSLSLDRSLKSISVRSRYQCRKPLEEINSEDKARTMGKAPVVLSRYLLECLSHSVSQCVGNSAALTSLELEGIPFPPDCLAVLCVGLSHTQTLRYLSLQRCYIGDSSCELVCRTVADVSSVRSLNLSSCDLTFKSGSALAAALSRQKLSLYHDTWKQSLRYQEPNIEAMPGLRRLTLNDNPQLGDTAAIELIEAIRDSLWLKALDMQRCGLTDKIANDLLELLTYNTTLMVLDVRQNANLNEELVKDIMKRLERSNVDAKSDFRWLGLPEQNRRVASAGGRKRTENENKTLSRPRSAMTEYAKTTYHQAPSRKSATITNNNVSKIKGRPHVPPCKLVRPQQRHQEQEQIGQNGQLKPKMSLHLDLQSHIQPVIGEGMDTACNGTYEKSGRRETDRTSSKADTSKVDATTQVTSSPEVEELLRTRIIQVELAEARAEHDRLVEETKRSSLLLAVEKNRREEAEAKLNAMRNSLTELENALKEKEQETNGAVMLSQQSLDEICSSFDRLLEMLDSVTRNPNTGRTESTEMAIVQADIKERVVSVIRQTKSENLRRGGFVVNVDEDDSIGYTEPIKKLAKSESDVRTTLPPISTMHLERNIGDSPDVGSSVLPSRILCHEARMDAMSPRERARTLFKQILHADSMFDFCNHVD